jgi:hypothetical protein
MGRKPALQNNLVFPDDERGNEPSKAYRLNLKRYEDATYMNLGTMCDSPEFGVGQLATICCTWGGAFVVVRGRESLLHTAPAVLCRCGEGRQLNLHRLNAN